MLYVGGIINLFIVSQYIIIKYCWKYTNSQFILNTDIIYVPDFGPGTLT